MRICFELLDLLKAHKKGIRRAAVNSFGYIAKSLGPQDVLSVLLTNLRVQERQSRVCSTVAIAIVAVTFTLIPQILLSWKINVYLLGGIGLTVGILVGPRGVGGTVMDLFDPAARQKKKNARGGAGAAPKMPNIPGLKPKSAAQLGAKRGKDEE